MQICLVDQFGEMPELANGLAWKASGVKAARGRNSLSPPRGLAEWLIALASKARGRKSSRGSNPLPSASYGDYRITVSPRVCGTRHLGSTPSNHPKFKLVWWNWHTQRTHSLW